MMRIVLSILGLLLCSITADAQEHRWKSFKKMFGFGQPLSMDEAKLFESKREGLHFSNRKSPEDSQVIFQTAMNLFGLREYEQAAEQYYRLLQKHPKDGQLWIRFVQSLYMTGDYEAVKKTAALAEKMGIHNTLNLILVADIAYEEGNKPIAKKLLKAILVRTDKPDEKVSASSIRLGKTYALENLITLADEANDVESAEPYQALLTELQTAPTE